MKTSLIIDDQVIEEAKKESLATGKTLSQIISHWARLGKQSWLNSNKQKRSAFKAADLGEPLMDLSNRKNWMEELEDDRS